MAHTYFNITAALLPLLLVITACWKRISPAAIITGLISVGYSLVFDISFGDRLGLYYYISPPESTFYMVLSAVLVYLPSNVIYLALLPERAWKVLPYTLLWIAGMLLFEYVCRAIHILEFTGWQMMPWSVLTYVVTYVWLIPLYNYLSRRLQAPRAA